MPKGFEGLEGHFGDCSLSPAGYRRRGMRQVLAQALERTASRKDGLLTSPAEIMYFKSHSQMRSTGACSPGS